MRKVRSSCASDHGNIVLGVLVGGVIDQDVEPSELMHHVPYDSLAEGLVAHIAGYDDTAPALFFHQASSLLRVAVLAQVHDRHI